MTTPTRFPLFAGLLLSAVFASSVVHAQGLLTPPPGAPAPTMKSIDQIEARKPLGTAGQVTTTMLTIAEAGSYYLVGPVAVSTGDGIVISANNVALDLNGFTVSSTANPASGNGVNITARSNVTVKNGFIRGTSVLETNFVFVPAGFVNGVLARANLGGIFMGENYLVENLHIYGMAETGIVLGANLEERHSIINCHVAAVGQQGIYGHLVTGCTVDSAQTGIYAHTVSNCSTKTLGSGIFASTSVQNSTAIGIRPFNNSVAIQAKNVTHCHGFATGDLSKGIVATNVTQCIGTAAIGYNQTVGIKADNGTVSFSQGKGVIAIQTDIAVACTSDGGPISARSKQLGTR